MADCKLLSDCIFFNDKMANKPGTAEIFKKKYCKGDNSSCARFMVFEALGRPKVPKDLFPNQAGRAGEIIATG
jgi:hypothetical protein